MVFSKQDIKEVLNLYKIHLFTLILLCSVKIQAQHTIIKGKVLDKTSKQALPYTNIQVKNTGIGTITDKNGEFYLKIPKAYANHKINFSFIGYKTETKTINNVKKQAVLYLQAEDEEIGEIIIMPDSTLLTLLEKAYKKIPENYPVYPTKLKGFYRESIKSQNDNYLYFAEAVIETYKSGYGHSTDNGQVRIIKSLVNEFPKLDSLSTRFYGGVFEANNADIVKRNYGFINPKYFKNYRYSLYRITKYQGKDVYVINFDTQNDSLKGTTEGRFYIEKKSLAYISFNIESTRRGLKAYNKKNIGVNSIKFTNTAKYVFHKEKWHLKYSYYERLFYSKKILYKLNSEYITTKIETDTVQPVAFNQRMDYSDIFSEKAKSYHSNNYWEEYNVLKKDSFLEKQLVQLYDTAQSKKLLTKKTKYTKKNMRIKILSRFSFMYGAGYYPIATEKSTYSIVYRDKNNIIEFNEELDKISYDINLIMHLNYKLNYRWEYNFAMNGSFGDRFKTESYETGLSYQMLVNKKNKPLILKLSLFYSYNKFIRYFSTYQNNTEFEFGGKTIDAEKLKFGIGNTTHNIKPQISLEYKLKRRMWLYTGVAYYIPFHKSEKLFLEETSGSIFSRKKTNIALNNPSLELLYNGQPTTKSHLSFDNYSFSIGILFKL